MPQDALACTTLAPLAMLLATGGDERILPDPQSGLSRYACRTEPESEVLELGSSTASTISAESFAAAETLYQHLQHRLASGETPEALYAHQAKQLRERLQHLLALPQGTQITLAASGTDAHLIAAQWIRADCCISVAAEETGSGVPAALQGLHPSPLTPSGQTVLPGTPLDPTYQSRLVTLAARELDGNPSSPMALHADCTAAVEQAIAYGEHILLVLTDVSKSGLIVPDVATVQALQARYPQQLTVLVDACQCRLAPTSMRAYLAVGFLVAITGSKFFAGPTFSAALFCPAQHPLLAQDPVATARHLQALAPYSSRHDWPENYAPARQALPAFANFGLLLRWHAALVHLEAFLSLPEAEVAAFLQQFATRLQAYFAQQTIPLLQPLPQTALIRRCQPGMASDSRGQTVKADTCWDLLPTIFPFLLYGMAEHGKLRVFSDPSDDVKPLDSRATRWHYQELLTQHTSTTVGGDRVDRAFSALRRIRLGQPVDCGARNTVPVSALRLCVSAPMLIRAVRSPQAAEQMIAEALDALEALRQLLHPALSATQNNTATV